jgi:hypothetical protein
VFTGRTTQCADAFFDIVPVLTISKRKYSFMEAALLTVSSTMTVIRDKAQIAAALEGTLTVHGKPVLVTKGNDMAKTVAQIYRLFAAHKDTSGQSFMLSAKHKGLVHHDNFGCISKLTN